MYTWFPYQSSDHSTEMNDITLLDSWVISTQGNFTKNTDLFPRKINKSFNGCPMKALVFARKWFFTTKYVNLTYYNGTVVNHITGLEMELLSIVLQQMNMTFIHVPTTENSVISLFQKEIYIIFGNLGNTIFAHKFLSFTNSYSIMTRRWYVPCSDKYPRWSSIFRIISVELWLILIISIVIVAISTTLFGRYSCTSERQGYKTLKSSFTNLWAVILGVSVPSMPRTLSLRSLFLAWVCFSLAFRTVFQEFLTSFLIDSGYITPIQNKAELLASGINLAYPPEYSFIFESGDETELSKLERNRANCPSYDVCVNWAKYHKNVSILMVDRLAEVKFLGENSEPLVCRLDDGIVYSYGQAMVMFHGDPLLKRINEIIDQVVEAGLYNYWISLNMHGRKILSRKIAIVHPFDGYYSFNLYHMQPAFYLLLMGWCISVLFFMVEFLYGRVLSKGK